MSVDIQRIRANYQKVGARVQANKFDGKLVDLVAQSRIHAEGQRQTMIASQSFAYLEETNQYIQKYAEMQKLMQMQRDNKVTSKDFVAKARLIFPDSASAAQMVSATDGGRAGVSPQLPQRADSMNRGVSPQRAALSSFFDNKASQIQPGLGFRSVLETPPLSPRNFRKRQNTGKIELESLISENHELKSKLDMSKLSKQDAGRLETQYNLNKQEIEMLEKEYSKLTRDNFQLKSERSVSLQSGMNGPEEDYLYSPYTFNTRRNDIYMINVRNMHDEGLNDGLDDGLSQDVPAVLAKPEPKHHVIYKKVGYEYENYTEEDYAREQGNVNFSIFDINKSYLSENGDNAEPDKTRTGIDNPRNATRNKVAFFRPKGIIVRNTDIEIGYKKSEPEGNMVRVILFFNNKNADYKTIRTDYKYEQDYYELTVTEKIRELNSFRQGREVVEVRLRGNQDNFNSVIDVTVYVGQDVYKLWLPAMFIRTNTSGGLPSNEKTSTKGVYASKAFSKPSEAAKVIENLKVLSNNEAQFWCQSSKGNGLVNLQWKPDKNKLNLTGSEKWLQLLSFLMLENS